MSIFKDLEYKIKDIYYLPKSFEETLMDLQGFLINNRNKHKVATKEYENFEMVIDIFNEVLSSKNKRGYYETRRFVVPKRYKSTNWFRRS